MNKSFLLITLISVGLVVTLYSLPKIIVGDKKKASLTGNANRDKPNKKEEAVKEEKDDHKDEESHSVELSADQQKKINSLSQSFSKASATEKISAGTKLAEQFSEYQKYDSAAFYAEKVVVLQSNEKNWLATANYYYQAFTFAVNDVKSSEMGEKARFFYQKALDKNPNLLQAKTNMAMTYVSTPTPMSGILLLREVIAQSPDFEPALFNLGLLSMRSNQFAKAVERFRHITKNNPNNTKAAFYLGISLVRLGRNDEAKIVLNLVKEKDKDPAIQAELDNILKELN
jgi:tetratricopeptide (TPR) repeat protein